MSSKSLGDLAKSGSAPLGDGDVELDEGLDFRRSRGDICTDLSLKDLSATDVHGVARGECLQTRACRPVCPPKGVIGARCGMSML